MRLAACENVSSTALRLSSPPVRHLRVTSSTLPVRAGDQRQSLSHLTANFIIPGVLVYTHMYVLKYIYLFAGHMQLQ